MLLVMWLVLTNQCALFQPSIINANLFMTLLCSFYQASLKVNDVIVKTDYGRRYQCYQIVCLFTAMKNCQKALKIAKLWMSYYRLAIFQSMRCKHHNQSVYKIGHLLESFCKWEFGYLTLFVVIYSAQAS